MVEEKEDRNASSDWIVESMLKSLISKNMSTKIHRPSLLKNSPWKSLEPLDETRGGTTMPRPRKTIRAGHVFRDSFPKCSFAVVRFPQPDGKVQSVQLIYRAVDP